MAIVPSTNLYLLHGVPIDKGYNHTLYFTDNVTQLNTFMNYIKYTCTDFTYQRQYSNAVKVGIVYDVLQDINYMLFQNSAYGNKWFYAFVDSIEYVNDSTTRIYYTIDEMQTWYFDYTMPQCFVEREHTETDGFGEHLVDEGIGTGDLTVQQEINYTFPFHDDVGNYYCYAVYYVPNIADITTGSWIYVSPSNPDPVTGIITYTEIPITGYGRILNEMYRPCEVQYFEVDIGNTPARNMLLVNLQNYINELIKTQAKIVTIKFFPQQLVNIADGIGGTTQFFTINQSNVFYEGDHVNSYTPVNNKLLSYPYQQISMTNNCGDYVTYKWEKFKFSTGTGKTARFFMGAAGYDDLQAFMYPMNYDGLDNNKREQIILKDFPSLSWSEDSFSRWWSQYKEAFIMQLVASGVGLIASGVAGVAGAGLSLSELEAPVLITGAKDNLFEVSSIPNAPSVTTKSNMSLPVQSNGILSSLSTYITAKNTPDSVYGQSNANEVNVFNGKMGFTVYIMTIQKDVAESIDNYFSMYGYKVNKVKEVNVRKQGANLRHHWNYVKTVNSIILPITGKGLPQSSADTISKIYDHGITFWMNPSEVGDYSLAWDNVAYTNGGE